MPIPWTSADQDPNLAARKLRAFARLSPDSAEAVIFVALADWLERRAG